MSAGKWGESFLKSGLPLEHLTYVTFRSMQWDCSPHFEYSRPNREKTETWFEVDLVADCPFFNKGSQLSMLVECKYHDPSRYWFFLPHESTGRWRFDDRVLNCAPYQTLVKPRVDTVLQTAPLSANAMVVAEDGTKQDNAAYTAIQQAVNGFVPWALSSAFMYNIDYTNVLDPEDELDFEPAVSSMIPVVVTNAALYRLKPQVTDLDLIRKASGPGEVADQLGWTWCYHDVPASLAERNARAVAEHERQFPELVHRFPRVAEAMHGFVDRPNWIAVVNISSLPNAVKAITDAFLAVQMKEVKALLARQRQGRKTYGRRPTKRLSGP